jgi:hypothetical protein
MRPYIPTPIIWLIAAVGYIAFSWLVAALN